MEVSMNNRLNRLFALGGIVAAVLNIFVVIFLDMSVPGYNSITQYVSEFGIIPGMPSLVASIWWTVNGLLLILFSGALNSAIGKGRRLSIVGPLLICFYGLFDSIGSVIFPMYEGTFSGMMHYVVSFIGITAVIFSPVALVKRIKSDPRWAGLTRFTWITQVFFWIIYVICVLAVAEICFSDIIGLLQRVFIFAADIWIAILGYHALKALSEQKADE